MGLPGRLDTVHGGILAGSEVRVIPGWAVTVSTGAGLECPVDQTKRPPGVLSLRMVNRTATMKRMAIILMVALTGIPMDGRAQWPQVPEIAGRGGAAGAAEGVMSPLRPALLPTDGQWHVRLDHQIPYGVLSVSTVSARVGWAAGPTGGGAAWMASMMATRFDAYSAMRLTVSVKRWLREPETDAGLGTDMGMGMGVSLGWDHERMGVLGARGTPIVVVGWVWNPLPGTLVALNLLNGRASRLNGAVVGADVSFAPGRSWPVLHATVSIHPEFGPSVHIGSTWRPLERVHLELGGAGNPFRAAASLRISTGNLVARLAMEWKPVLGTSRWISAGWS